MNYTLKLHNFTLSREVLFLWFPVFLAFGIYVSFSKDFYLLLLLIPFIFSGNIIKLLIPILLGFIIVNLKLHLNTNKMLTTKIEAIKLLGSVEDLEYLNKGIRFILKSNIGNIRVIWRKNYDTNIISPGNKIEVLLKVFPIKSKVSPIAYDFKRQAFFNGISAGGVVLKKPKLIKKEKNFYWSIKQKRDYINKKIIKKFDNKTAGIAAALLTGNKSNIDYDTRQSFIQSGIAHILAISGLHVSLIAGFVFSLIRILLCLVPGIVLRHNPKKIAVIFSFFASLIYIILSNGAIPAIRALIMHTIITVAILLNKKAFSIRNISISATVILLLLPEVIFSPGFYMSFFAVTALISFYENKTNLSKNYFKDIIYSSIIASSAVIPFSIYYFNNMTINSIPANLIAIPLTGIVIMPALFFFTIGLESVSYYFIKYGILILTETAKYFSSWSYSYFLLPTPPLISIQIISLSMLLIFLSRKYLIGHIGIILSIFIYISTPKYLAFISDDSSVFGIIKNNTLYVNSLITKRSTTNSWMRSAGLKKKAKLKIFYNKYTIDNNTIEFKDDAIIINNSINIKLSDIEEKNGCLVYENGKVIFTKE